MTLTRLTKKDKNDLLLKRTLNNNKQHPIYNIIIKESKKQKIYL